MARLSTAKFQAYGALLDLYVRDMGLQNHNRIEAISFGGMVLSEPVKKGHICWDSDFLREQLL
jgi:hypothetical protein